MAAESRQDKSEKMVLLLSHVLSATSAGLPSQGSHKKQQKQTLQDIVNKLRNTRDTAAIVANRPLSPPQSVPPIPTNPVKKPKKTQSSSDIVVRLFKTYEPIERYIAWRLEAQPKQKPAQNHVHVHTWLHSGIIETWLTSFFGTGAFVFDYAFKGCPGQQCKHLYIYHHDLIYTVVHTFVRSSIRTPGETTDDDILATLLSVPWSKYIMNLDMFDAQTQSESPSVAKHVVEFFGLSSVQSANKFLNDLGAELFGKKTWRTYVSDIRQLPLNRLTHTAQVYYGLDKRLYLALTKTYNLSIEDIILLD